MVEVIVVLVWASFRESFKDHFADWYESVFHLFGTESEANNRDIVESFQIYLKCSFQIHDMISEPLSHTLSLPRARVHARTHAQISHPT